MRLRRKNFRVFWIRLVILSQKALGKSSPMSRRFGLRSRQNALSVGVICLWKARSFVFPHSLMRRDSYLLFRIFASTAANRKPQWEKYIEHRNGRPTFSLGLPFTVSQASLQTWRGRAEG